MTTTTSAIRRSRSGSAPPKAVPETYQNIINTYPAVMDAHLIPSRGYTAAGWRGNWKLGVSEDADGYVLEAAIPVADFGMPDLKNGDRWRLLLCRTCQGSQPRSQGSWSATQAFSEIPQYPPVLFRDDELAVQVEGVHTLLSGKYRIPLTLVAPAGPGPRRTWNSAGIGDRSRAMPPTSSRRKACRWQPGAGRPSISRATCRPSSRPRFRSSRLSTASSSGSRSSVPEGVLTVTVQRAGSRHGLPPVIPVHRVGLDLVASAEAGRCPGHQTVGHDRQVRARKRTR